MGESVVERMNRIGAHQKMMDFNVKMKQPYDFKKKYAELRIREFIDECNARGLNTYVSVGGLDSIILYLFIYSLGYTDIPAVSVSYLEDPSNQIVHRAIGCIRLMSSKRVNGGHWNKFNVIQEFGFPVLSKETAAKIELLQNPSEKNATARHAIITGETGEYGGWNKNSRMKMSQRWLEKFGGYENETEGTNYETPNFRVSIKCCYYLKEKPVEDWAKENNSVPFMGLMASEGGRRAKLLKINGCNYFGKSTIRSCPFAIFERDDILRLALEMDAMWKSGMKDEFEKRLRSEGKLPKNFEMPDSIIPTCYGTISFDGSHYETTGRKRTGCTICGFGVHLEKRPHRFDVLYLENKKQWEYIMFHICKDEDGTEYGWARVLDYIGVGWNPNDISVQQSFDFIEEEKKNEAD